MSTDLELCQNLPKIRLSPIPIQTPEPSESKAADSAASTVARSVILRLNDDDNDRSSCNNNNNKKINEEDEEENECRTPTSAEHRIPPILSCPPAPRKPARAPSCKRKLSELDFFDVVNREEVNQFFRSSFAKASAKRSCCPCK